LLQLTDSNQYQHSLVQLYGKTVVERAQALIRGEDCFAVLVVLGMDFEGSKMHQQLLIAYRKLID
jgi:ribosomal protein S12 methylthiotransferase accessory factor